VMILASHALLRHTLSVPACDSVSEGTAAGSSMRPPIASNHSNDALRPAALMTQLDAPWMSACT
jgi:hypothetical protein